MNTLDNNPRLTNVDLDGLYSGLTPEELAEAEYNLTRYIDVVRRIYERVNNLTGTDPPSTL
jgi:hypothetical protein